MRTRPERSSPAPRLKNKVPPTTRVTGSKWPATRGMTEGLKVAASIPPTTASDATRPQRGTVGCSFHTSARARATSIGPTSHPAGRPAIWAKSPASKEPTTRTIHPTAVRIAFDPCSSLSSLILVAALAAGALTVGTGAQGEPPEGLTEKELLSRVSAAPERAPDFRATVTVEQTLVPEGLIGASEGGDTGDSGPRTARV